MYVDSSVIMGMTGGYDEGSKGFGKLQYMVCRPENDFFPDLSKVRTSPLFTCSMDIAYLKALCTSGVLMPVTLGVVDSSRQVFLDLILLQMC